MKTRVQENSKEQGSSNSCEKKSPRRVVRTGCRKGGKKGSEKSVKTRVQAVDNNSYEEKTEEIVCPCSIRHK